jgi:monoterpene epsilon-lactone hydrolase
VASAEAAEVMRQNRELQRRWASMPDATFRDFRASYEEYLAGFAVREDAIFEDVDAAGVPCIRVRVPPSASPPSGALLMHFHSGGYVIGSARGYRSFGAELAVACGCEVLLADYRRAPEAPAPAALEDALAVYRSLLAAGRDPARVVLCGDSAGGGLVFASLQALRDAGDPLPAGAVAISPWADLTLSGESMRSNAEHDPLVSRALLSGLLTLVLGPDGDPRDWRVSPLFGDWRGLPPLMVLASTTEVVRDDAVRCVAAARAASVDAGLLLAEGMVHVWPLNADRLPEAREALARIAEFVTASTGIPPIGRSDLRGPQS